VRVPALSGCFTRGDTLEECRGRTVEAIAVHVAGLKQEEVSPTVMMAEPFGMRYTQQSWSVETVDSVETREQLWRDDAHRGAFRPGLTPFSTGSVPAERSVDPQAGGSSVPISGAERDLIGARARGLVTVLSARPTAGATYPTTLSEKGSR
jgi:hypothetical protein